MFISGEIRRASLDRESMVNDAGKEGVKAHGKQ